MSGWIKLHRQIQDWEWYEDSSTVHLWIHMLLKANHDERKWQGITINPGQFITSRDKLSAETGITTQRIRTIIERLKSTSQITSQSTSRFTMITISKWEGYQSTEDRKQPADQPADQPTSNQQVTSKQPASNHKQELKELKELKEAFKEPKTTLDSESKTGTNTTAKIIKILDDAAQRKLSNNNRYLQAMRNAIGELESQGVDKSRILKAVEWYKKNGYYRPIDSARALVASFTDIENQISKTDNVTASATNTGGAYHLANIPEVPHQEPPPGWTPPPKKTIEEIGEGF